jgi:hypothetical protein
MNADLLHILQHSLGCDQYGRSTTPLRDEGDGCFGYYRNRFVTDPASTDGQKCEELVRIGLMKDFGAQSIAGGMHCYAVTRDGIAAMHEHSAKPPKLTRSQERYRRYRECADCFENFRAFLRYEQRSGRV